MKKILKLTLLVTALTSSLMAEVVFDLGAQQLSNSVDGTYIDATYDTGDSIVSTGLAQINGYYRPKEYSTGHFGVQIKQAKSKWAVSFNMFVRTYEDGNSIDLTSSEGEAVNIYIGKNIISVNGNNVETNIGAFNGSVVSGSIEMHDNQINIIINGSYMFIVQKPNFKLKQFNMILTTDSSSSVSSTDQLNSLTISTSN